MTLVACTGTQSCDFSSRASFNTPSSQQTSSAFDHFVLKHRELAQLSRVQISTATSSPEYTLRSLVLLGAVSAIESYCRELLRRLVSVDPYARTSVVAKEIPYGAAVAGEGKPEIVAEALFEGTSFSSPKRLASALQEFSGLQNLNQQIAKLPSTSGYQVLCELRHCVVHRYGHLGIVNATTLGFDDHRGLASRQLRMESAQLEEALQLSLNLVAEVNNLMYLLVLKRAAKEGRFVWDKRKDMRVFKPLALLFLSEIGHHAACGGPSEAYELFRAEFRPEIQ